MKRNEATIPGFGGNGRTKGEAGGAPKGVGERQRRTAEKPADAAGDSGPGLSAAAGTGEAPPGAGGGGGSPPQPGSPGTTRFCAMTDWADAILKDGPLSPPGRRSEIAQRDAGVGTSKIPGARFC